MKYLDYNIMPETLSRFFPNVDERLIGPEREVDSGYYDIIRFFDGGPRAVSVALEYSDDEFSFSDNLIETFARKTAALMQTEGRLFDGPPAMHLLAADFLSDSPSLTVCRCDYHLQAGSCFALDLKDALFFEQGGSLRQYYLSTYPDRSTSSPLPACLGICGVLLNRWNGGHTLWVAHRSARLASLEDSVGPTAAGSVDYFEGHQRLDQLAHDAMAAEIDEELGLIESEYELTLLAFAREIYRGEKPQLFCLIETALDETGLALRLDKAAQRSGEADRLVRFETDRYGRVAAENLARLNHETATNLHLAREYLVSR